jgi:superfamily II DNA or RNA helicase
MTSNTLLTFFYIEHGVTLCKMIKEKLAKSNPNRKVFFVYGGTDAEVREEIRHITEKENDAIIVASVGVFSTGINIKNLDNIIFGSPSKSRIRVLQSIGRSLRIGRSDKATLYDVVDDLEIGSHKNFALQHFFERVNYYDQERHPYKIVEVVLS